MTASYGESELSRYMHGIPHTTTLSRAETARLIGRIRTSGDREAMTRLVKGYLWLVKQIALKFLGRGLPVSDLMQEGYFGLVRAAEKFDSERGVTFQTYARYWIRQKMLRGIAEQRSDRPFALTRRQEWQRGIVWRNMVVFETIHGRCAEPEELLAYIRQREKKPSALELTIVNLREILKNLFYFSVTADALRGRALHLRRLDTEMTSAIATATEKWSASEITEAMALHKELWDVTYKVCRNARERRILFLRFQQKWTLEKTGHAIDGLTKQRISQIEHKALKRIGHIAGMPPERVRIILSATDIVSLHHS